MSNSTKFTITPSQMDQALITAGKVASVRDEAKTAFVAMDETIDTMATAFVSGEHLAMLAMPGTAKTALGDYFAGAFGVRYFYSAAGVETKSSEMFGPVNPLSLDRVWERNLAGAATHSIVFVDELGKAPQEVQNLFLAIMQERKLPVGDSRIPVPLHTFFTATNETLDDNPAFWDRFLLRCRLNYINDGDDFIKMIQANVEEPSFVNVTDNDLANLRHVTRSMAQALMPEVLQTMGELWNSYRVKFDIAQYPVSNRRWKHTLICAAGNALLNGMHMITSGDLAVARFILWSDTDKDHVDEIQNWVMDMCDKGTKTLKQKSALLVELEADFAKLPPNASPKDKGAIYYKAKMLQGEIASFRGRQWQDLKERTATLLTNLNDTPAF